MYKTQPFDVLSLQLIYDITNPKVWDACAFRPNRQSDNYLNGAHIASKAHKAKIPQE